MGMTSKHNGSALAVRSLKILRGANIKLNSLEKKGSYMEQKKVKPWWGYSIEHGWVYLDRSNPVNQSPSTQLMFIRCDQNEVIDVERKNWIEPEFFYEECVRKIATGNTKIQHSLNRLEEFKAREREFASTLSFCIRARQAEKTKIRQQVAATVQPIVNRTPEQVRAFLKPHHNYTDDEWNEIIRYCAWMKEKGFTCQIQLNNYITRNRKWDNFKVIRRHNYHGYGSKVEGISPAAYRAVCEILGIKRGSGNPLIHSETY